VAQTQKTQKTRDDDAAADDDRELAFSFGSRSINASCSSFLNAINTRSGTLDGVN
jgi:hypothetical protein